MPVDANKRYIFISHAGEDAWVARQIAQSIDALGAQTFLSEIDIEIGAEFEEDLRTSLGQADEILALVTPWALERPYVWAELGAAWILKIPIVVLLHGISFEQFQAKSETPVFLKKRDMIRLNDIDQYLEQLKRRVDGEISDV